MKRKETRLENARAVAQAVGGIAAFARKMKMSDSQASQLIGENPTRNIGDKLAERIEEAFKLPPGGLDLSQAETEEKEDRPASPLEVAALIEKIQGAANNGFLTENLIGIFTGILRLSYGGKKAVMPNERPENITGSGSVANAHDALRELEQSHNPAEGNRDPHRSAAAKRKSN
ncbi:hypothetical protein BX589_12037 [Paraburkholderia fungorum]|jgi:transcriptional regulator with XRE-family HTH domain|uniref:hypothetical protein n=1 Tax=Paraburkholderia fungorum TaxID=134537 RepID=UPI000D06EA0E|nr:hypothetical protein [Paraburkholderia fungorum]PRZ51196.1 hypothetical protein BX589_12037 [Paraburkholderia fungorum]